ncbi:MAG: hypothetical protein JRH11_04145 [Deltaproteobacteria bacterium]|nr:hypothetical protein [Deltaproteobacteria bacterium]
MHRFVAPSILITCAGLSGCGVQHLTVPDLVVGVRYHQSVAILESGEARARSGVSGLVALRMGAREVAPEVPPRTRRRRRDPAFPCASAALCAWEAGSARRTMRRLIGVSR